MIICKSPLEIEKMRKGGLLLWEILNELKTMAVPGVTTYDLEKVAEERMAKSGAEAAFKGLYDFPCMLCTSVNDEIVHGIPSKKKVLKSGDILKIDFGVKSEGFYADSAVTVPVGKVSPELEKLIRVTEESLFAAIDRVQLGGHVGDVSAAVEEYVKPHGYSVVRDFVGHGIGTSLHEEPKVPNFGVAGRGPLLKEGMALAIEPMVNTGTHKTKILADRWTAVTEDGGYSAHFEHTVVVTKDGPRILTRP